MNCALLIMDVQVGVVERQGNYKFLERVKAALAAAREAEEVSIIFVRVAFRPGFPEISPSNRILASVLRNPGEDRTVDGPATQIHPVLEARPNEPIVVKKRVSAFAGSDLEVLLRSLGISRLVLCGLATSGVVLSTVREAADRDYELVVLDDACADSDPELHRMLIEKIFPRQAEVLQVDAWIASLFGD